MRGTGGASLDKETSTRELPGPALAAILSATLYDMMRIRCFPTGASQLNILSILCFVILVAPIFLLHASAAAAPVDFNRDIRPLFARHCTACHGGVKTAGKISFLYREKAVAAGKSGKMAIVPGAPEDSELIRRITTSDEDDRMPPSDHGPKLGASDIGKMREWIREGAKWSQHWSFEPPRATPKPKVKNSAWPKISADSYILARMESAGLKPSPEAKPAEWLRRVTLDLTGLPPSPDEYASFLSALRRDRTKAREQVVDRLLASSAFGERWASVWLDLARYSDTFGFEKDPKRDIWPWRDWVIRALNDGMPYDQFTIKQIAGDLLPQSTADDLLATAFHRNTQNNTEGGTDDEEYRMAAVLDRVNTTWTAWQATTFGCAQCHHHPYDPFSHRDYYRFAAFFNNTEDCDQNDDFPRLFFPKEASRRDELLTRQVQAREQRAQLNGEGLKTWAAVADWRSLKPVDARASGGLLKVSDDGHIRSSGTLPVSVKYTLTSEIPDGATALRVQIFPGSNDPVAPAERGQMFSKLTAGYVMPGTSNQPVKFKEVIVDYLDGPREPMQVIEGEGGGFGSYPVMKGPRECVLIFSEPLTAKPGASLQLVFEHGIASNSGVQGCPLTHFALSTSKERRWIDLVTSERRQQEWKSWRSAKDALKDVTGTRVPVMLERQAGAKRETRVFIRGNRLTLSESVSAGIPDVVQPPPTRSELSRLDLARWLVGKENPLASRVLANRLWAEMLGQGIVETLGDFGTSGSLPTHPELLDHLALRLRDDLKWSIKAFLRELALSATYAQSSRVTARLAEIDPHNALYARGPRARLTAEMVRDQALALSGLLSTNAFGPPVFPPQPEGVWSTVYSGEKWETSTNENRFRRGIYTFHRRTSGYPLFLTFDAPTRDACVAKRIPSNTPLQALATLNDPAFVEMAQGLASIMMEGGGKPIEMIDRGARRLTLSKPPPGMVSALVKLYYSSLTDFRVNLENATRLGSTPEKAALTVVANAMLNLDAFFIR